MIQFKRISMRLGLVTALILVLLTMMVVSTHPVNARPQGVKSNQPLLATKESDDEEIDLGGDEDTGDNSDEDTAQDDEDEDEPKVPDLDDIDLDDDPDDVIDQLRENDFLSTKRDGKLLFTIPPNGATFLRSTFNGLLYLPMGQNKTAENFVLYTTIEWKDAGKDSQCGVGFRWQKDIWSYAYLGNDGTIEVGAVEDNDYVDRLLLEDEDEDYFSVEEVNSLVLIANNDEVQAFVNSKYVGTLEAESVDGTFLVLLTNAEGNKKRTYCIFRKGWVWSFDS